MNKTTIICTIQECTENCIKIWKKNINKKKIYYICLVSVQVD